MTNSPLNQVTANEFLNRSDSPTSSSGNTTKDISGEKKNPSKKSVELDNIEINERIKCDFNVRKNSTENLAHFSDIPNI